VTFNPAGREGGGGFCIAFSFASVVFDADGSDRGPSESGAVVATASPELPTLTTPSVGSFFDEVSDVIRLLALDDGDCSNRLLESRGGTGGLSIFGPVGSGLVVVIVGDVMGDVVSLPLAPV
jgi:hypothetical protein